jgi:hypothetical protein
VATFVVLGVVVGGQLATAAPSSVEQRAMTIGAVETIAAPGALRVAVDFKGPIRRRLGRGGLTSGVVSVVLEPREDGSPLRFTTAGASGHDRVRISGAGARGEGGRMPHFVLWRDSRSVHLTAVDLDVAAYRSVQVRTSVAPVRQRARPGPVGASRTLDESVVPLVSNADTCQSVRSMISRAEADLHQVEATEAMIAEEIAHAEHDPDLSPEQRAVAILQLKAVLANLRGTKSELELLIRVLHKEEAVACMS